MNDELQRTARGFAYLEFRDNDDQICSLQKSSMATEDAIRFGVDRVDGSRSGRMHLTRDQAAQLLPYLQRFVETGEVIASNDSAGDTLVHISKVQDRIAEVCERLEERAAVHDASKLVAPEKAGYDQLTIQLKDCVYGSDAYKAALAEARDVIAHHYAHNDHHPEHWPGGINDMSLLSITEMLCDWKAASERTKQGSIAQSLVVNAQRFGIDLQLAGILANTVRELGW